MSAAARRLMLSDHRRPATANLGIAVVRENTRFLDTRIHRAVNHRHTMFSFSAEKEFIALTTIPPTLAPVHFNWKSIFTRVTADEPDMTKALELFLSSINDETITMKEKYNIYIKQLCQAGNLSGAAYLLRHLHGKQIDLCLNTYNILLDTASEAKCLDMFSEFFKNLLISSLPPNSTSNMHVAKAFRKVADSELLEFIRDVAEITSHKDPTVMNRIIFATAKSGQLNRAIIIFEELKKLACKMDTVTFNTVLAMLGRAGRVDKMLSEFSLMKDLDYTPDIVTYNTLVNCLRWLGRLDLCNVLVKEMIDEGIDMDLRTYTALIDGLGRAGHVQDALRIFDEMKKSQRPSIYVYRALIGNLKKTGKYELALNLLEEMKANSSDLLGLEDFKQKRTRRRNEKSVSLNGS